MKQTQKSTLKKKSMPSQGASLDILLGVLITAYIFIPTFTPNLMAFDTNAPKFLALALVNLIAFITLMFHVKTKQNPGYYRIFFNTWVGLVYTGFLIASLLSFFNAINGIEWLKQITKIFTVFSAVYILSVILSQDNRFFRWIVIVFSLLLIFDAVSVFYYIAQFSQGKIESIGDIKSVYSNKNILASALFVKVPFALWLLLYGSRNTRILGWIGLATGFTAILFMATRAFYLGLIILTLVFTVYMLLMYLRKRHNTYLWKGGSYLVAIVLAYLAFTIVQQNFYPKESRGRHTQRIEQQLATVKTVDPSARARFNGWEWSWQLIKEKPLLGVGSGNWKIVVLKIENRTKPDFTYMYKAHNDFIEITAETGFIGGLLFLGIFALIAWAFLRQVIKGANDEDELYKYLLLALAGVAFYSVDAFFNFPADRPEILILFSFYVATAISMNNKQRILEGEKEPLPFISKISGNTSKILSLVFIAAMAGTVYINWVSFQSSKTQRIVYQEVKSGKLQSRADQIISDFPFLPNITEMGEAIATQKARYLLNEKRYEEALNILRADQSTPWDGRREYFMCMGFDRLEQYDSLLVYAEKLRQMKPKYAKNVLLACEVLQKRGENDKVRLYLDELLVENKMDNSAWAYATSFYLKQGEIDRAWSLIEEAKKILPYDTLVGQQYNFVYSKKFIEPYQADYNTARDYFNNKDYGNALIYLDRFIANVPANFNAHRLRAYSYYHLKRYNESLEEIKVAMPLNADSAALINLRGVCYHDLKNDEAACKDFEKSMKMGNADGKTNYERFCGKK